MCRRQYVLALITVYVGLAHSWDLAVSLGDILEFYTNGTKTKTVDFKSFNLATITYDEVHDMILFVDKQRDYDAICGYNLSSEDIRCFVKRYGSNIHDLALEPALDLLFFTDTKEKSINWISLEDLKYKRLVYGNVLIKMNDRIPVNIGVDSCKGYIYWSNQYNYLKPASGQFLMERAKLFSYETQGIYQHLKVLTFAIDPQTQTNYFVSTFLNAYRNNFFNKADLKAENFNLNNKVIFRIINQPTEKLTVSKDHIYWVSNSRNRKTVWQILKNATITTLKPKQFLWFSDRTYLGITTNYRIKDQVQGLQNCEALSSLIQVTETELSTELDEVTETDRITYESGTDLYQSSNTEGSTVVDKTTKPDLTTEFYESSEETGQTESTVVDEASEIDRTTEFYESTEETAQTAELYQSSYMEKSTVVDETTEADRTSEFYESSEETSQTESTVVDEATKLDLTTEFYESSEEIGQTESTVVDEASEIDRTTEFYESTEETAQTAELYQSSYMEKSTVVDETTEADRTSEFYESSEETSQTTELYQSLYTDGFQELGGIAQTDSDQFLLLFAPELYHSSYTEETTELDETTSTEIYKSSTEQTEQTAETEVEHAYGCDASCSLNTKGKHVCQCKGDSVNDSCEVSSCLNYCFHGSCGYNKKGHPVCRCNAGYSGKRCEIYACHGYCLNNGDCSLNEEDEPVCGCVSNYEGSRCEAVKNNDFTFTLQLFSGQEKGIKLADLLSKTITKMSAKIEVI